MAHSKYCLTSMFVFALFIEGCSPSVLYDAADSGNLKATQLGVQQGLDIDTPDYFGHTPLYRAILNDHAEIVYYLVDHGAKIEATDGFGQTPIFALSKHGDIKVVQYLIEHGAQINVEDKFGQTPLFMASYGGHIDIVKYYVEYGTPINIQDNWGNTALHYAASRAKLKTVKFLVEQGSDINTTNNKYEMPIDMALDDVTTNYLNICAPIVHEDYLEKQELKGIQEKQNPNQSDQTVQNEQKNINTLKFYHDKYYHNKFDQKVNEDSDFISYLPLLFSGPKGMKVGYVIKLLSNGMNENNILSLIKQNHGQYRNFTSSEIHFMLTMGLTKNILSTMMETTTNPEIDSNLMDYNNYSKNIKEKMLLICKEDFKESDEHWMILKLKKDFAKEFIKVLF